MDIRFEKNEELEKETKKRVKKMGEEFKKEPVIKMFENTEGYDQIIAQAGITFLSACEHHLVGFEGEASIGYIPNDKLIGLSKIGRIVEYFLNPTRPTIQEKATQQIFDFLEKALEPKGLIVVVKAKHGCIGYRGVKKPSWTITSAVGGGMKENQSAKEEFLSLISKI